MNVLEELDRFENKANECLMFEEQLLDEASFISFFGEVERDWVVGGGGDAE